MKNSPQLSIIIPVYNSQDYIEKCLNSCLTQDVDSVLYEIIIVNDGSTDNSEKIIQEYRVKYSNIKSITIPNGGVSVARNYGISLAEGEYLLFVDSDDTIKKKSLCLILDYIKKTEFELTFLNSILYKNNLRYKEVYLFPSNLKNKTISGENLFLENYIRGSVCGVLFNRNFINKYKLQFPQSVVNGEDYMFMTFCLIYAKYIKYLNLDFYQINIREESASRSWNIEKVKKLLNSIEQLEAFADYNSLNQTQKAMISINTYGIISNSIFNFFALNNLKKYHVIKSIIKKSKMYPIETYGVKHFKYKILLLNFSIDLFCLPFFLRHFFFNMKNSFK